VFMAGYGFRDTSDWDAVRMNIHVPVFNTDMPGLSAAQCAALGVGVVLYYGLSHFVAQQAVRQAFRTLAETGSAVSLDLPPQNVMDFDEFLGIGQAREDAKRYGLLD
jgi:2-methylisocitrate lyase-like PEP mutase family enzyme